MGSEMCIRDRFRTIHKAKGAQFPAVVIILEKEIDLEFIHSPELDFKEEHRIYYVAASRARDHMFFSVPELSSKVEGKVSSLVEVIRI